MDARGIADGARPRMDALFILGVGAAHWRLSLVAVG